MYVCVLLFFVVLWGGVDWRASAFIFFIFFISFFFAVLFREISNAKYEVL